MASNQSNKGIWTLDGHTDQNAAGPNYTWFSPMGEASDGMDFLDTRNMPYFGQIKHLPLWEACIKIIFYVLIIFGSLVGNLAVVIVVARNKKMRTTTNYYIVNLAVTDLMITLSCQWVHLVDDLTEGWVLGAFFCKFNSFAQGNQNILILFFCQDVHCTL